MDELIKIIEKYQPDYITEGFKTLENLNAFALAFYTDVSEIYGCLTRIKNVDRNPTGFSIDDAPILGLLVRIAKLLKEVIAYYEKGNADIISILERPMLEASVVATYLMRHGPDAMLDYRKCSYKDRLRILRQFEAGLPFFDTKPGKRLLKSVQEKMADEGLSKSDFADQKKNGWKLQGKTFFDILKEVEHEDLYAATYGMMSESIHGSWNESLDWCLVKQTDATFKPNPFSYPADVRFVSPTLRFTNTPFRLWLERINAYDDNLRGTLDWIEKVNGRLFQKFDTMYDG